MSRARLGAVAVIALLPWLLGAFAHAEQRYVVRPGDTLYALASRFDTTVAALVASNRLDSDVLRVGQVLNVPGGQHGGYRITIARPGETLADVARRVGRSPASLASANPGLANGEVAAGAAISVPPADGVSVEVAPGDTLASLAARSSTTAQALARANDLSVDAALQPGQSVLLPRAPDDGASAGMGGAGPPADGTVPGVAGTPGAAVTAPAMPPSSSPASSPPASPSTPPPAAPGAPAGLAAAAAPTDATSVRGRLRALQDHDLRAAVARLPAVSFENHTFRAPVHGRVSSRFGWRALSVNGNHFHAGVDLAVPLGTPVHAARDGTVVKAGWGGTYGNVVFLDHGDGTQTRYAHLSRIEVRVGESLRQGDVLGLAGSTGASTGPHVHFELRFDGRAVDPLDYLQSASAP